MINSEVIFNFKQEAIDLLIENKIIKKRKDLLNEKIYGKAIRFLYKEAGTFA